MIANLRPYPEYKESGSPWLGRMPTHWSLVRLGSVLRERRETNEEKHVAQVLSVLKDVGVIRYEDKGNIGNKKSEDIGRYKIVRPDDIVVNCMNVIIGSVGRSRYTGCLSPVYYVLTRRSEADNPRYLAAIFSTKPFHESLVRIGNGILAHRMRIPMELLKCEPFPAPPPDEQAAMVRFLDYANGRLERAIRAKRKVIALLHEQKQAIIHRAVTRGLDPAFPLKPSGIPWLGDIPKHWEITRLRRVCFYQEGPGLRTWQFTESGIQVICVTNITANGVNLGAYDRFISREEYVAKYRHFTVERGDVMLASSGNSWGKIAEFNGEETVILNTSTIRLNPARFGKLSTPFLKLVLTAEYVRLQLQALLTGSCQPNFGPSHLNRVVVTFPSDKAAQDAIVSAVTKEIAPLSTAIARLEREIGLLREYRMRLVADVVTGKLDVRPAARQLPEETGAAAESEVSGSSDSSDEMPEE